MIGTQTLLSFFGVIAHGCIAFYFGCLTVRQFLRMRRRRLHRAEDYGQGWQRFLADKTVLPLTDTQMDMVCWPELDSYKFIPQATGMRARYLSEHPMTMNYQVQQWALQNIGPWGVVPPQLIDGVSLWFSSEDDAFMFKVRWL